MSVTISMWRHAIHQGLRENPGRSRYGPGRGRLRRDRLPGERSRTGKRHANDVTLFCLSAGHTADSDVNASAVARHGRDASSYGRPAAA